MALFINTLAVVTAGTVLATAAFAQSAKEVALHRTLPSKTSRHPG